MIQIDTPHHRRYDRGLKKTQGLYYDMDDGKIEPPRVRYGRNLK